MTHAGRACSILIIHLLLSACTAARSVETRIPFKFYESGIGTTEELVVFLPGRGDEVGAFERAGFIDNLKQSIRPLDSVVVDAHMGYYKNGSLPERVHDDILTYFQHRGYQRFILVGVSLGGYGALWVRHEYEDLVSGIVLLAPYLGSDSLIEDIKTVNNLHLWSSSLEHPPDIEEMPWFWLDEMSQQGSTKIGNTLLGYGSKDKFADGAELLAPMLNDSAVFRTSGNHNWSSWITIWTDIMQSPAWMQVAISQNTATLSD